MSRRIAVMCDGPFNVWRHRWRWRETHLRTPDGTPVMDRWCERCGRWYVDVVTAR